MRSGPGGLTLYDVDAGVVGALLTGEPSYRVAQVWQGLYEQGRLPAEMTNLPAPLRQRLTDALPLALHPLAEHHSDDGETLKTVWSLQDGARVESVLMYYADRCTVCVSSQAGCAMGCGFCATGQAGFTRHLGAGEIVEQVIRARRRAAEDGRRLSNVVLMGMGEPLANYDRVWAALRRIHDHVGLSARHLTVSTVGIVPGILRMATEAEPVNLAVSLHAADDELRDELVPINRRYPLEDLMAACRHYLDAKGRRLSFEWALIAGTNDRPVDAEGLAARAVPLGAHVNLIPLNPTPGWPTVGTAPAGVRAFRDHLASLGVNVTVRRNRGTDIAAACGQLSAAEPVTITRRSAAGSSPAGARSVGAEPALSARPRS